MTRLRYWPSVPLDRIPEIINKAAYDANAILPANGSRGIVEMGMQIIDADAKPKGLGKAVFRAATQRPRRRVNRAYIQSACSVWEGPSNPCPTDQCMGIGAQLIAVYWIEYGTNQVVQEGHRSSRVVEVRDTLIANVQFRPIMLT